MAQHQSKYRHVFGEAAKPENQYAGLENPLSSGEGSYVKANPKFYAVAKSGGGGPLYIRRLDKPGRVQANAPMLSVHKGTAWDFDFHPFINTIIATGSEDTKVAISKFPIQGLNKTITDPEIVLDGHAKKVVLVTWNPTASSILASGSFDKSVKIWNIETGQCVSNYNDVGDNIYSLDWNYDGSLIAATAKDKKLRIYDPRSIDNTCSIINEAFDGTKSSKVFWAPKLNWIGATGFSKDAKRQLKIWDCKNLKDPIFKQDLDQVASVLMPMYDDDLGILYLAGKGDGSIQYYELVNNDRILYTLGVYRTPEPQKGGGWVPKRGLEVMNCEVQRFLKLTGKSVIPVSFIVPRKVGNEVFQQDIYPDTFAGKPSLTADEWISGQNKNPMIMSLDPAKRQDNNDDDNDNNNIVNKKKSYHDLEIENQQLKQQLKALKNEVAQLKGEPLPNDDEEEKSPNDNNKDYQNNDNQDNNNNNNNEQEQEQAQQDNYEEQEQPAED